MRCSFLESLNGGLSLVGFLKESLLGILNYNPEEFLKDSLEGFLQRFLNDTLESYVKRYGGIPGILEEFVSNLMAWNLSRNLWKNN